MVKVVISKCGVHQTREPSQMTFLMTFHRESPSLKEILSENEVDVAYFLQLKMGTDLLKEVVPE